MMKPSIFLKNPNLLLIIFLLLAINFTSANPDVVNYSSNLNQKSKGFYSTTNQFTILPLTRLFPRFPSFYSLFTSINNGDNATFEAIFRPMEFREPIIMIPIEGRYGMGFYGVDHLNPFRFDYGLITYEDDSVTVLKNNNIMGRFGHFMEFNALQINPSYYLFKKSYFDIHVGLSFRYFSVMDIPTAELGKYSITGPPEVPSDWPLKKTFAPRTVEGNILSSLILQWHPKWFLHLKYSYGMNRTRFYQGDGTSEFPYGNGTSSTYSVGLKFIRESKTAARYAIGLELKYMYLKIDKIVDPNNVTPITGIQYPMFGLYLNIGVFYGGNKTIGDDGKEHYLEKDYVSAAKKFQQFLSQYPHHARRGRAEKLIEICNHRIPNQLYTEGNNFKKVGKIDRALEKYVEASKMADGDLKKRLDRDIELIAQDYISMAESLFISGETDDALRMARSAASISESGQDVLKLMGVKITIRQGEVLATHGMYAQALEKFAIALEIEPSLWIDIRWNELKVANKMLEDVNKAYDEGTVRLAIESIKKSKEIMRKSDEKMDRMIEELERQLKVIGEYRVKQRIDEYANEARWKNIMRYMPKVELGMLVTEVQDILGEPDDITQRVDDKNRNYQMWIYNLPDNRRKFLYFEDYVLFKVEEE